MKSSLLMLDVVPRKLRAEIWPPAPTNTPLGFNSQTWPLASSEPSMSDICAPVTRLSAIDELPG